MKSLWYGVLPLVLLAAGGPVRADIITYKDGATTPFIGGTYAGTQDTMILTQGGSENENFGARFNMEIGSISFGSLVRHGLVRFDITSLNGRFSSINSVKLRFYVNGDGDTPGNAQLFQLAPANSGWIEGTHQAAFEGTATGESTWLQRVQGSQNWAGSQGASTPGVDYLTPLIASTPVTGTAVQDSIFDFNFTDLSFIDDWAAGNNPGLFLRLDNESVAGDNRIALFTRNNGLFARNPELIIDYVAVPEPGTFVLAGLGMLGIGLAAWRRRRAVAAAVHVAHA